MTQKGLDIDLQQKSAVNKQIKTFLDYKRVFLINTGLKQQYHRI